MVVIVDDVLVDDDDDDVLVDCDVFDCDVFVFTNLHCGHFAPCRHECCLLKRAAL